MLLLSLNQTVQGWMWPHCEAEAMVQRVLCLAQPSQQRGMTKDLRQAKGVTLEMRQ